MDLTSKFSIENEKVVLNKVTARIRCAHCRQVIALQNEGVTLIKGQVALAEGTNLVLRCGKCKNFTSLDSREPRKVFLDV